MKNQQGGRPYRRVPSPYMVDLREKDILTRRCERLLRQGRREEAEPYEKRLDQIAQSEDWIRSYSL